MDLSFRPAVGASANLEMMRWIKQLLLVTPFMVALVLNVLIVRADHLHLYREGEHIAGYAFLFATPWAWLIDSIWSGFLDRIWRGNHSYWLAALMGYATILWIPATLYSACLWLLVSGLKFMSRRHSNLPVPD